MNFLANPIYIYMYTFNIVSTLFLEFSLIPGKWYMLACVRAKLLQSCLILCDPVNRTYQTPLSMGFSRQEY